MRVSRKGRPTRVNRKRWGRSMWKFLLRMSRNGTRRCAHFIKWRGGRDKFDENTHDPKERLDWALDEIEDEWDRWRKEGE